MEQSHFVFCFFVVVEALMQISDFYYPEHKHAQKAQTQAQTCVDALTCEITFSQWSDHPPTLLL